MRLSFLLHLFIGDLVLSECLLKASCGYLIDEVTLILKCFFSPSQLLRLDLQVILLLGLEVEWLG